MYERVIELLSEKSNYFFKNCTSKFLDSGEYFSKIDMMAIFTIHLY